MMQMLAWCPQLQHIISCIGPTAATYYIMHRGCSCNNTHCGTATCMLDVTAFLRNGNLYASDARRHTCYHPAFLMSRHFGCEVTLAWVVGTVLPDDHRRLAPAGRRNVSSAQESLPPRLRLCTRPRLSVLVVLRPACCRCDWRTDVPHECRCRVTIPMTAPRLCREFALSVGVLDPPFGRSLGGWNVCGNFKTTSC